MRPTLTYRKAAAGGRVVHALVGGGPGTNDVAGIPRYFAGVTWCGVEKSHPGLMLAETDAAVTCKRCLAAVRAWEKRHGADKSKKPGRNGQ